jgi:hypothetical protein
MLLRPVNGRDIVAVVSGGTVQELSAAVLEDSAALLQHIVDAQVALEPPGFYTPDSVADLHAATREGLQAILSCLAGRLPREEAMQAAVSAGRRQVQQDLPLEGVLRAYRVAGREVWEHYVALARAAGGSATEELLVSASALWTEIDAFSAAVTAGYRTEEASLRSRDERVRQTLLAALLDGRASDPTFARDAARALGLATEDRLVCVVGLAHESGATALDAPAERMRREGLTSIWMSTPEGECGLVLLGRSNPSAARAALAGSVRGRAGMSPLFTDIAELPRMARLAEIAARCSSGTGHVALPDDDLPAALAADSPLIADLVWQRTVGVLRARASTDTDMLLDTVNAYLAADASLNDAANDAYVHRNTMKYRLNKVEKLTGVSLRELKGQMLWVIGLRHESNRVRP